MRRERFFVAGFDECVRRGWLDTMTLPWQIPSGARRSSTRYLVAHEPVHANGRPFRSPREYVWNSGKMQVELNFDRGLVVSVMMQFMEDCARQAAVRETSPDASA